MPTLAENDRQLIPFLRNLADSIESETLLPDQLRHIGEFYMSYMFSQKTQEPETDDDDFDIVKFITMGWYVYKMIQDEKTDRVNDVNDVDCVNNVD